MLPSRSTHTSPLTTAGSTVGSTSADASTIAAEVSRAIDGAIDGTVDIGAWVRDLALVQRVTATQTPIDTLAHAVSRLAYSDVRLDPVEQLLVAFERAGTLAGRQSTLLHGAYLRQATAPHCH